MDVSKQIDIMIFERFALNATNVDAVTPWKKTEVDKDRPMAEGESFIEEVKKEDGSHLIMLLYPWEMPLQLCQRRFDNNEPST